MRYLLGAVLAVSCIGLVLMLGLLVYSLILWLFGPRDWL